MRRFPLPLLCACVLLAALGQLDCRIAALPLGCLLDGDCPSGLACLSGSCSPASHENPPPEAPPEPPPGDNCSCSSPKAHCHPQTLRCLECLQDSHCTQPPKTLCDQGSCKVGEAMICDSDSDCASGFSCFNLGAPKARCHKACVPRNACPHNAGLGCLPIGSSQSDGVCLTLNCNNDGDCQFAGYQCRPLTQDAGSACLPPP